MRIKRYHLAYGSDPEALQTEVSKLIAEGWQPLGEVVVALATSESSRDRFLQTMVQYEGEIRA